MLHGRGNENEFPHFHVRKVIFPRLCKQESKDKKSEREIIIFYAWNMKNNAEKTDEHIFMFLLLRQLHGSAVLLLSRLRFNDKHNFASVENP